MKRMSKVAAGQRYRSIGVTGKPTYTYEVEVIFHSNVDQRDYVRLIETVDPTRTKTIAVATLQDPRHFVALPAEGEGEPAPPVRSIGRAILDQLR